MAPVSINTTGVELLESEIIKPQPLRIIKRSQTVASCSPPRKTLRRGRRSSSSTVTSQGSPTLRFDGPLTVRKKRGGRSSAMTESLNNHEYDLGLDSPLQDLIRKQIAERKNLEDDPDVTPKASRGMARTISAGAFLKSELHQRSSEIDATRYSVRGDRSNYCSQDQYENLRPTSPMKGAPIIPERRLSKSKNFFLRAIAGQTHNTVRKEQPKSIHLVDPKNSKNTLIRRLSRGKSNSESKNHFNHSGIAQSSGKSSLDEPESSDITDVDVNSKFSSSYGGSTQISLSRSNSLSSRIDSQDDVFVLSPQIIITPEVSSVDTKDCHLWIAIEINGQLRQADGYLDQQEIAPSQSTDPHILDLKRYGRLYSMRITFDLGPDCILSDLIGDLNDARTLRAGETHLFLAKAQFRTTSPRRHVREASSHDLMAELRHDLGDTLVKYLTVRLNYRHSGFAFYKDSGQEADGTVSHTTRLFTEASAVIKRHNSQSAWSPRTSQTMNEPLAHNPLMLLIKKHLSFEEAREAIKKISAERLSIPLVRRVAGVTGSSEETVKPESRIVGKIESAINTSLISKQRVAEPAAQIPYEKQDESDPARKIWTEMRRHSRGHGHQRKSISADHYFSLEEEPVRSSSGDSAKTDPEIDREREKIMEVALRNKRSVGQETLRSMAPSIDHKVNLSPQKAGTMSGLGLGTGSRWWGQPWW